jgi:hypothetical protein
MAHRGGEVNMAHPLTAYLGSRYLHPAFIADDAPVTYLLVLAAIALKVLCWAKDALTEKPILLWLQGTIIDSLGFSHFTP